MDMENSYKALFELLWNSQIPCFDVMNVTSKSNYEYGKLLCSSLHNLRKSSPMALCINTRNDQVVFLEGSDTRLSKHFHTVSHQPRHVLFIQHAKSGWNVQEEQIQRAYGEAHQARQGIQLWQLNPARMVGALWLHTAPNFLHVKYNSLRFDPLPEAGRAKGLSLMLDAHSDLIAASSVPDDFQANLYLKYFGLNTHFHFHDCFRVSQQSLIQRSNSHWQREEVLWLDLGTRYFSQKCWDKSLDTSLFSECG